MKREIERKVSLIHALAGVAVGVVSPFLFTRKLTFVSVIIAGLFLAYPLYILTRRMFGLPEKEFGLREWLGKGFLYFFAAWILVWTMIYNFMNA